MNTTIPFTYLIGWSFQNKWYYGARWADGCSPEDLWKTYFTSSKYVKQFIREHGQPNVIQIRRTFLNKIDARRWETNVLRRIDAANDKKWLNKTIGDRNFRCPGGKLELSSKERNRRRQRMIEMNKNRIPHNKGVPMSEETKALLSKIFKSQFLNGRINHFRGKTHTEATKQLIREKQTGKRFSNEINKKKGRAGDLNNMKNPSVAKKISSIRKNGRWFNNGTNLRFFDLSKIPELGPEWVPGKKIGVSA